MPEFKRTFDEDLFNRKPYAEFLKTLILNSGAYHRDDDVKAYTIAIDSPWGTGKSVFLEKFENLLETECGDTIRVVHYNAWKNDFWNNAFEPFAEAIFSSDWFCSALDEQTSDRTADKVLSAAKNFAIAFLKGKLEKDLDLEYAEKGFSDLGDAVRNATSKYPNAISKEYAAFTDNLELMQQAMDKVLHESLEDGKLVVIIDELDRCRPTFAIETLEIVKHIMDVENVVYIFALDVKQLGAAIRQVYGADTDATGYLMRFFSYYSRMPDADLGVYLQFELENIVQIREFPDILSDLSFIAKEMQLSVRDVETIGKSFRIMLDCFLKEYHCAAAYRLYWMLLCSKYKYPIEFNRLMRGISDDNIRESSSFLGKKKTKINLSLPVKLIGENKILSDVYFEKFKDDQRIDNSKWNIREIKIMDEGLIFVYTETSMHQRNRIDMRKDDTMSGLLFYPDVLHWEEIKHLTPGQFLLQQMEMFNFLPISE